MLRSTIAIALLVACTPALAASQTGDRVEIDGMQMYYEVSGAG